MLLKSHSTSCFLERQQTVGPGRDRLVRDRVWRAQIPRGLHQGIRLCRLDQETQ